MVRVGGNWKVNNPDVDIPVPVKLEGSDRFGPNKNALSSYKKYRFQIPFLWEQIKENLINDFREKGMKWNQEQTNFILSEILINNVKHTNCDIVFAFQVEQDEYSLYSGLTKEGRYTGYERFSYEG